MDILYQRIRRRNAALVGASSASADAFARLADHPYCLVATHRMNGEAMSTRVWFALDGSVLYFRTAADAVNIRRIRANPSVRIAACNARRRLTGPAGPLAGIARVLECEEAIAAEALLDAKYGRRRAMYSAVFRGPWEYVGVSSVAPLPASIVGLAYETAVRLAGAATELEEVLGRIQAVHASPSPVALAIDSGLAELRVYAQASQLLAPTEKFRVERAQLIEQLQRSLPLVQWIRRCEAWYDDGIMQSDDGQRAIELSQRIYADSLNLPFWMRDLDLLATDRMVRD